RITAEPIYELKTGFSHHAYLCAEHVEALRTRIGEMREPPLGLEEVPHPALEVYFDEIRAVPTTQLLLTGIYQNAVLNLLGALGRYRKDTNPLTDAPSLRVIRFAELELEDMYRFGNEAYQCLVTQQMTDELQSFTLLLHDCRAAAGDLDGICEPV